MGGAIYLLYIVIIKVNSVCDLEQQLKEFSKYSQYATGWNTTGLGFDSREGDTKSTPKPPDHS